MWGQRTTTACRCSLLFIAGFTGKKGVCRIKRTKCLVLLSCWKIKLLAVTCFPDGAAKSDRWKYDHRKVLFWPDLQDHWLEISPKPWQSPHLALQICIHHAIRPVTTDFSDFPFFKNGSLTDTFPLSDDASVTSKLMRDASLRFWAYPSCDRARGRIHPWQVASLSQGCHE